VSAHGPSLPKARAEITRFHNQVRATIPVPALMDVRITRTGSFTLYGDPAIINLRDCA
jgi:hypothetical protein